MSLRPLIAICGTTGVGKSKFAIDLALKLADGNQKLGYDGARIINADSMQVYSGMDIITNKVPEVEMKGVEHLLMGFKKPGEQYIVGQWVSDAVKAIDETHAMKKIPIVVGGTSYWIQHLIFPDRLASKDTISPASENVPSPGVDSQSLARNISSLNPEGLALYGSISEAPDPDSMGAELALKYHALLSALDPVMAARWHWKDTRKVLRSLTIMKDTGRQPSEIIFEQSKIAVRPRYRTLCFWLHAERSVLHSRLNNRVDQMIKQGLVHEIITLRDIARSIPSRIENTDYIENLSANGGQAIGDFTLGIYQSIGYKEFHDYLTISNPSEKTFNDAIERMKISTRQYAKRQISWLRNKLLPAIYASNADYEGEALAYLLDASDVGEKWDTHVRDPGEKITEDFLDYRELADPKSLSDAARELLTISEKPTDPTAVLLARRRITCQICSIDEDKPVLIEEGREWELHVKSRTHKKLVARSKRLKDGIQSSQQPAENCAQETRLARDDVLA